MDRIPGLTWRPVKDAAEVAAALAHGTEQRATSATAMNAASSRSHAVLSVKLTFADGGQSLLHLVDLAGGPQSQSSVGPYYAVAPPEHHATSLIPMNAALLCSHAVLSGKPSFADGGHSLLHLVDLAGKSVMAPNKSILQSRFW